MTMIDPAALIPIRDALQSDVNSLTNLITMNVPPLPVPPVPPVSGADGSAYPNKNQSVIDSAGHVFGFGTNGVADIGPQIWGYNVLRDGIDTKTTAVRLIAKDGHIYVMSAIINWSLWAGASWVSCLAPILDPVSADGSSIVPPVDYSQFLVTSGPHYWSFGPSSGGNNWVLKDGHQYASGMAAKLTVNGGVIWAQDAAGGWWKDTGGNWAKQSGGPA